MEKQEVIDLIKDAGFGFLATSEGNQPRVRPIMPYLNEDGNLLLAVFAHHRSVKQVQENPLVEICYVDRRMSLCRIAGKAKISADKEKKEILWHNIPMLKQYFSGPGDSNFVLVEVLTESCEVMTTSMKIPEKVSLKNH